MTDPRGPLWRDWRTVVCVGSGPSLDWDQVFAIDEARIAGRCRVIVCNSTWRALPNADVLYASDAPWWHLYAADVRVNFTGEQWTQDKPAADRYGLSYVRGVQMSSVSPRFPAAGLSPFPDAIYTGGNTGYAAIGLAYLFGATRIVLAGYDMQRTGGRSHHHPDHPKPLSQVQPFPVFIERFDALAKGLRNAGIECINATRESALQCFPRMSLEDALNNVTA